MIVPTTLGELNALVDNDVAESLHLDYKESRALTKSRDEIRKDIAKDVSAFANSDGGVIVYGVVEIDHLPVKVDDGVENSSWSREKLESIINSNISPRPDGIRIHQIPLSPERSSFVVEIPKTVRGPHQERVTMRFYKRFNFSSEPMESYEIDDVRNRSDIVLPLISVDIEIHRGVILHLRVQNIGDIPAEDVKFTVSSEVEGLTTGSLTPNIITAGTSFLPPGKTHRLILGSALQKITKERAPKFDITAEYFNRRAGRRVTDIFKIDYADYFNSAIVKSDVTHEGERLAKTIGDLIRELTAINGKLEIISTIAGSTGLDLSVTTLRNLLHVLKRDGRLEKISASAVKWQGFADVLRIDHQLARRMEHFCSWPDGRLEDIEGMTKDIARRARAAFVFEDVAEKPRTRRRK